MAAREERGEDVTQIEVRFSRSAAGQPFDYAVRLLSLAERVELLRAAAPHVARLRKLLRELEPDSEFISLAFNDDPLQREDEELIAVRAGGKAQQIEIPDSVRHELGLLRNEYLQRRQRLTSIDLTFHADEADDDILESRQSLVSTAFTENAALVPVPQAPTADEDDAI